MRRFRASKKDETVGVERRGRKEKRWFDENDGGFFTERARSRLLHSSFSLSLSSETTFFTFASSLYFGWMSFFIATTCRKPRRCGK